MADAWKEIGMPQGSYPYMAPEQYLPEDFKIFRPDIFSLGVIVTEMITGRHPCGRKTIEIWEKWPRKKWKTWANSGKREIKEEDVIIPKDLKEIIKDAFSKS